MSSKLFEQLTGNALVYDSSRNEFVNAKHQRIAEIIADYDPDLRLLFIPQRDRTAADIYPYAIGHGNDAVGYDIIMYVKEEELDERLLARLWMNDSRKNDPLHYLEKLEEAREAVQLKEELEKREERMDKAKFMIRSPYHTINMGNGKKIRT